MLSKFYQKLLAAYGASSSKYECRLARTEDIPACLTIRKQVFGNELQRQHGARLSVADMDGLDEKSLHILCLEKKSARIVGCLRMTPAAELISLPEYCEVYRLGQFPASMIPRISAHSRMAVLREHRRGPVGLLLACKGFELGLTTYHTLLSVVVCEPNLYPMYRRLGYRPLDKVFRSPFGGYRLPLVLVFHDYSYLRDIRSPFYEVAQRAEFPSHAEGLEWFHHREVVEPGFTLVTERNAHEHSPTITDDLSASGQKELLRHAMVIKCHYGDLIIQAWRHEKFFGFVRAGAVEVSVRGKLIAMLGQDDVFGETSFILDHPMQTDFRAAQPNTEVVLVGVSAIQRLSRVADQIQIWKNLSKILALRLTQQIWSASDTHPPVFPTISESQLVSNPANLGPV